MDKLYKEGWPLWVGYVARRTNPDVAEDIVADVVLRVLEYDSNIRHLEGFIYRCLDNACIDWYREQGRNLDLPLVDDNFLSNDGAFTASELVRYAAALSPLARECIMLRYVDGASTEDMSRALGLSPGSVKWALWRSLESLRDALDVPHAAYGSGQVRDRRQLVGELRDKGHTVREIRALVGVSRRTVYRDLAANKKGQAD